MSQRLQLYKAAGLRMVSMVATDCGLIQGVVKDFFMPPVMGYHAAQSVIPKLCLKRSIYSAARLRPVFADTTGNGKNFCFFEIKV